jgi:uroporphyrinogen decarboxylase
VRPLLPDVLAVGFAGLQGFQRECGMDLEWIINLRTRKGDPLLIFGPMSVTTVLPHGAPEDVRDEVIRAMHLCANRASLVFFTSNTINPDVPLENLRAYFDAVIESRW